MRADGPRANADTGGCAGGVHLPPPRHRGRGPFPPRGPAWAWGTGQIAVGWAATRGC